MKQYSAKPERGTGKGVGGRTGEEKGAYGTFGEWGGARKGEII